MANIRQLKEGDDVTVFYPQTHVKAVIDSEGNTLDEILENLEPAGVEEAVKFTPQTLTTAQKTQARTNIGAGTYSKAGTGIPASDMASAVQTSLGKADTAYQKPSGGIPKTDLASAVQGSLDLADTAIQSQPIGSITPPVDPSEYATAEELSQLDQEVVYDVTLNNGGTSFASLSALLSDANLSTLIPTGVRTGGMSIRFLKTPDNKFVQYRLIKNTWSTNVADWQSMSLPGVTNSDFYNTFIRELYLTGLNENDTYCIGRMAKNSGGAWYFTIAKTTAKTTPLARFRFEASQTKEAFGIVKEANSSGISGYAVVDWNTIPFSVSEYDPDCLVKKTIVSELFFNPTIYAYLNDVNLQNSIDGHVEIITSYLPSKTTGYDNPTILKDNTKVKYNGTDAANNSLCVIAPIKLEPGDIINLNKGDSLLVAADCSTLFLADSSGNWLGVLDGNSTGSGVTRKVSYKNAGISDIYVGTCTQKTQKSYSIEKKIPAASDESVNNLNERIESMTDGGAVGLDVYAIDQHIKEERPYFLNEAYDEEVSYDDTSYLDTKLRNIPDGKHFLFVTDSHIDYTLNGVAPNFLNKETEIMAYVKAKLNAGVVIFGGDAIGAQLGDDSSYRAAKILSIYANDKFSAFGSDFLWCQGNHDANGNTASQERIPSFEIYKRTTKIMQRYGKAVFDTEGLALLDDYGQLSADDLVEAKSWFYLHYYYDDTKNKTRFIVLETGDQSYGGNLFSTYKMMSYISFVAEALQTAPDGYDAVIVMHQMGPDAGFNNGNYTIGQKAYGLLYSLLDGFKNHTSVTLTIDGTSGINALVTYFMNERIGSGTTYDFTSRTSGRVFMISGHFHVDDAWIVQNPNTSSLWNYYGKEYGYYEDNPTTFLANAILHIQVDRAQLNHKGNWPDAPYAVTADNNSNVTRLGTKNEVLFNVITITPDNKVVCTRIGAGNDIEYTLP